METKIPHVQCLLWNPNPRETLSFLFLQVLSKVKLFSKTRIHRTLYFQNTETLGISPGVFPEIKVSIKILILHR